MSITINGFALLDPQNNTLQQWVTIPSFINIPGVIQIYGATVGWSWNGYRIIATSWTDVGLPVTVKLTDLLSLFTQSEQLAIASGNDPRVNLFMWKAAAVPVTLNDTNFQAGLNYLVGAGIITAQRAQQISSNVVQS